MGGQAGRQEVVVWMTPCPAVSQGARAHEPSGDSDKDGAAMEGCLGWQKSLVEQKLQAAGGMRCTREGRWS